MDAKADNEKELQERLIRVEQQQIHHKETLNHISKTLEEVVKTQHILANQKNEIDNLKTSVEKLIDKGNKKLTEDAAIDVDRDYTKKMTENISNEVYETIKPEVQRLKLINKVAWTIATVAFTIFGIWFKSILGS